jgi:hypothetical protein
MSMADLIQWGRTAQRTGLLELKDEQGKTIRVVFRDGRIVFSSTNVKAERFPGYLVFLGLCSREDAEAAFRVQEATGDSMASVLVQQGKITTEQAISTLTEKTIEDVCEVFLWPDGSFHFEPGTDGMKSSVTINIDPIPVVWEGLLRAEVWSRMNAQIHLSSVFDTTDDPFPASKKWEDARIARHVLSQIDGSTTVGDLVDRLPFSRFKVFRAISELLAHQVIRLADVTAVIDRDKRLGRKIEGARAAAGAGRWSEAIEMLQGLVSANPDRPEIAQQLETMAREFEQSVREHNFTKDDVPVVTIGPDALSRLNINPAEGFLLSRVDGRTTIGGILKITPIGELEGLRAFKRLLTAKVIDFPYRKPG